MSGTNKSDKVSIIIGTLIVGFIIWKVVAFILPDEKSYNDGQELLEDVMVAQGGLDNWNTKERLHFTKSFVLFAADGSVEINRDEIHSYRYGSQQEHKINWKQENKDFTLIKNKERIFQLENGQLDSLVSQSQLEAKLSAAQFVMNIPYSLNSANATLEYEGVQVFQDDKCHVLQVQFKDSRDSWRFYYSQDDLSWVGYWVQTEDHYSLVINEEMTDVGGFTLSRKRKSYRTDEKQNSLYLRAQYMYGAYKID